MMWIPFEKISENAKMWIYTSPSSIPKKYIDDLEKDCHHFCQNWKSHNTNLLSSFTILENHCLVLCVDESHQKITGCSIDASLQFIKSVEKKYGLSFLNRNILLFQQENKLFSLELSSAIGKLQKKEFHENTLLLDNTIDNKKKLSTHWQIPVYQSWLHKKL